MKFKNMTNYSFDIFDTLISRKFANDKGIFVSLREKLKEIRDLEFPIYFIDEFVNLRIRAQKLAHEKSSYPEITLEEIYSALGSEHPEIKDKQLFQLQELEESLEIENCYSIPENVSKVIELLELGNKVLLISDMYLSKTIILQMLEKANPRLSSLPLYLSSELKIRKSDGTLYRHVCNDQKIIPLSLIHKGDNFHSDCIMAERSGVKSVFYKDSILSQVEKSYFKEEQNTFLQLVVGASKQTRLEGYNLKPSYRLGASFMGPMFYGFVYNLLKQAVSEGIKHIYFLARDGYLLKIIAEEIITCFQFDVEIHYLYTSRQATYFASIFRVTTQCFDWIFQEMDNIITFNRVAKRLHFEVDILINYLDSDLKKSIVSHGFDNRLTLNHINLLKNALLNNSSLKTKIESEAAIYRKTVIGYFEQEGLLKNERVGFVDIGWRGTLQDTIHKILKSKKPNFKLTSYYFAVTHFSAYTLPENRKVPAYMFPSNKPGIGPILELLLQCNHGTTISYEKDENGHFKPVLKDPPIHIEKWGVESYKQGIQNFSQKLSKSLASNPKIETSFEAITPILIEMLEDATPEVASILGDLYYSGDIEELNIRKFAPSFSVLKALQYMFSSRKKRGHFTQWFDASYSRSKTLPQILLKLDPQRNMKSLIRNLITKKKLEDNIKHLKPMVKLKLSKFYKK